MNDLEEIHDSKIMTVSMFFYNDGTRSTSTTINVTLHRTVFTARFYLKISIAANKTDRDFSIVLFNTGFDITKLLNGVVGNPYIKVLVKNYLDCIDFEPKFPMVPVSLIAKFWKINYIFLVSGDLSRI